MSILLIRHGETDSNRARVVQVPETPLSSRGLRQADCLAVRLAQRPLAAILTSDLARAEQTAQAVSRVTGVALEREPLLQERHFGDIRGTAYADLEESPFGPDYVPPGGESWPVFHERVNHAWAKIVESAAGLDGDLAVVTHGLVLHSLTVRHLQWAEPGSPAAENGPPLSFGNTSVSVVDAHPPWRVRQHACVAHLDEESGPEGVSGL